MSHTFEPKLIWIYGVDQVNILSTYCSLFLKEPRVFFEQASLVAQMVKNLPAIWETQVQPLENPPDPLNPLNPLDPWRFLLTLWRREWLSTPIFLPGEFHGQRSCTGHRPWSLKESDTTERHSLFSLPLGE